MAKIKHTSLQDFWQYVDKNHPGGCWQWQGSRSGGSQQRGVFRWQSRGRMAHHMVWQALGKTPPSKNLYHTCGNLMCVNPDHLQGRDSFTGQWGISRALLAQQEGVSQAAIDMRVMNYGTPFQRKSGPNRFERGTGRTSYEVAQVLNISARAVEFRFLDNGDVFHTLTGRQRHSEYQCDPPASGRNGTRFWLHPDHPDYTETRSQWHTYLAGLEAQGIQIPQVAKTI